MLPGLPLDESRPGTTLSHPVLPNDNPTEIERTPNFPRVDQEYEHDTTNHPQELREDEKDNQDVLPAFRKLPPELFAEIFIHACSKRPFHTRQTSDIDLGIDFIHRYRYGFTQVCSQWREICISTPRLWTDIPVIDEVFSGDRINGYTYLICAFLERSKDLPVDVVISIRGHNQPRLTDVSEDHGRPSPLILRPLLDAVHRWKSAVLFLHANIFRYMQKLQFPILEQLNVRSLNHQVYLAGEVGFPRHLFTTTPTLKTVISDGRYDWQRDAELMPYTLFRGIQRFIGLPQTSVDLEHGQSTLIDCTFRGPLSRIVLFPQRSLEFPELKRLRVVNNNYQFPHNFGGSPDETIFQSMEAPSLEELVVEGHPVIEEAVLIISHLVHKTLGAPSQLKSLTLHIAGITTESLMTIIEVASMLERLDVYDAVSLDWNFLVLQPQHVDNSRVTKAHLVPHLQSLVLRRGCRGDLADLYSTYQSRRLSETSQNIKGGFSVSVTFQNHSALLCGLSHTAGWDDKSCDEWTRPPKGSENTLLRGWAMFLMKQFLGWFAMHRSGLRLKGKKINKSLFNNWHPISTENDPGLMTFFGIVESYDVRDARLLEITGILHVMEKLAQADKRQLWAFENDGVDDIQPRARIIANKWKVQLSSRKKDMPQNWKVLEDSLTLVLPNTSE
ncbi:hypothetical protein CPB83DRAFT_907371 [Crepidotus variabilis]|uniref:F-box domain-containing protein n=1 Tax=Crepidotus variabilis TaxID=179855 RepID=A0A9P6EF48_9AGAR|nr:hypothetical protein CPB83DRAFT_907371 [Crepidotus variabilis]